MGVNLEYNKSNNVDAQKVKSRAIIIRCSDRTYSDLMSLIRTLPDVHIVYTKTSHMKLIIEEAPF